MHRIVIFGRSILQSGEGGRETSWRSSTTGLKPRRLVSARTSSSARATSAARTGRPARPSASAHPSPPPRTHSPPTRSSPRPPAPPPPGSWRAVLGIRPGAAATHDAIKKQFRRLSLLVHPDKNGCAAAEEAFKLLRQAFDDALLAARPEPDEAAAAQEEEKQQQPRAAAATHEEKPQTRRRQETRPECDMQRDKDRISIYCMSCHKEFPARVGRWEHENGIKCAHCPAWLERPWPKKPPAPKEPPAGKRFTCSWRCPRCETQCTSTVYFGPWRLECKACAKYANVYVKGPNMATATT
ncbi:hypothetical protein PR202_gb10323 [Eleusine coracana subsp. coracana]|uniref:J domain-containing protein n=1 Tax=Eleusine coracana subsp. coracana TaxID=191504 RepID=A0AAV5EJ04_ELECO|nr:hypothetical protein PR202_gb10323 [Eleusine coracana subsp. coracana]